MVDRSQGDDLNLSEDLSNTESLNEMHKLMEKSGLKLGEVMQIEED